MPDFATHYLFGDMLNKCSLTDSYPALFKLGLQGPDIFFFHRFLLGGSVLNKLGSRMHKEKISAVFKAMREFLENETDDKDAALAYMYGFLGHYSLDSVMHPFVYWKENEMGKKVSPARQKSLHGKIETDIDSALYKKICGTEITKGKFLNDYILNARELSLIKRLYTFIFKRVFGVDIKEELIASSVADCINIEKMLYSGSKALKLTAGVIDLLTFSPNRFASHFKGKAPDKNADCLNEKHGVWFDPESGRSSSKSVEELMLSASERHAALWDAFINEENYDNFDAIFDLDFSGLHYLAP